MQCGKMENCTKIQIGFYTARLCVSEEELLVFKLSGEYEYIEYVNDEGQPHRLDGPAWEWASGHRSWWENGERHRLDGPAIESKEGGEKKWYVRGKEYSKEEFERNFK